MNRDWMKGKNREEKILLSGFLSLNEVNKMPESEYKNNILDAVEKGKENHAPSINYGNNRSRFPDEFLKGLGGEIILYPLEWMADFVLLEHKNRIDSGDSEFFSEFSQILKSDALYYSFSQMKPQTLGLYAYTVLNSKYDFIFNSALEILDLYKNYYVARLTNDKVDLKRQVSEHKKWLKSIN
ncbi:MAG: hypothetical protein WC026_13275 [Hyphomicrobium sp.]|uniref:hypothetical protein n=1 Tax=Hyphomicrobium sp. TaxID=82 RepID=UPI003566AB5C